MTNSIKLALQSVSQCCGYSTYKELKKHIENLEKKNEKLEKQCNGLNMIIAGKNETE